MAGGEYPDELDILHRQLGEVHVFTSPDLAGLHHAHVDLLILYDTLPAVVSDLVRLQWNEWELFVCDRPFADVASAVQRRAGGSVCRLHPARIGAGRA